MQSAGSGINRHGVADAAISGKFLFKSLHLFSQNKLTTFKNRGDGRIDFRFNAVILFFQIEVRNHKLNFFQSRSTGRPFWDKDSVAASKMWTILRPSFPSALDRIPF